MKHTKKSLTVICHNLTCGGTEKVISNLIYHYARNNIETTIITLGPAKVFPAFKISPNTILIELPKSFSNNIFNRLRNICFWILEINKHMKNNKESIYLSFLTIPNILTILASLNININHYGSERNNPKYINLPFHWKLLRFITYHRMNTLIVQTKDIKKMFVNYLPKSKIKIIPNSIKQITYKPSFNKINSKKLKVLYLGRLEYQKGIDILLESITKIFNSKNMDKFNFIIVGNGSLSGLVEDSIKKNNLRDYIKFIKGSKNPNNFIRKSHIVLHPSRYEGMSNVVLEAMSYGKCVISTYQASSEIITSNRNGILLKENTSKEIVETLETILNKRDLLKEIGLNAIKTIDKSFLEEKILNYWSKVLKINK